MNTFDSRILTDYLNLRASQLGDELAFSMASFPPAQSRAVQKSLTWRELRRRTLVVAGHLSSVVRAGERVAIIMPQGLDYVAGFLGCLYAGAIAVPLPARTNPAHAHRSARMMTDCEPSAILTDSGSVAELRRWADSHGAGPLPVLAVDELPDPSRTNDFPCPASDSVAYLQYTSGPTREPAGVMISHGNLVANAGQAASAFLGDEDDPSAAVVSWLPLFHEMGLVLGIALPLIAGCPATLMDPASFLEHPARWLRLLAQNPSAITAAPNFAYDYCVDRIKQRDIESVDLSQVRVMINGGEPVRAATLARFQRAFGRTGLRAETRCPSYGLAEATVLVAAESPYTSPEYLVLDPTAFADGRVSKAMTEEGSVHLVSCGVPTGQRVCIVRPGTRTPSLPTEIGEILVQGRNVGRGYWRRPDSSTGVFEVRVDGERGLWLRTGDLGLLHHDRLFVTGRLKDVITVGGRHHYPQDLEETVQDAVRWVRRDQLAAFRLQGADRVRLVVVAELRRGVSLHDEDRSEATRTARSAVSKRHGLHLQALELLPPGAVPRTTTGKISRSVCRDLYVSGSLGRAGGPG